MGRNGGSAIRKPTLYPLSYGSSSSPRTLLGRPQSGSILRGTDLTESPDPSNGEPAVEDIEPDSPWLDVDW